MLRDLHTHSTASDGTLAPAALVVAAADAGVGQLALTDHDTTSGLAEAAAAAQGRLQLVNGVEISVTWNKHLLHVVGLGIDPASEQLAKGLDDLQRRRRARAGEISDRLARHGLAGAGPGARELAGGREPGRTHFARWLVAQGAARNFQAAFTRWLKPGRPGHVATRWADLEAACGWIGAAGGVAVLAHPARYRLTRSRMTALLEAFRGAGGRGLEVVRAGADPAEIRQLGEWAVRFDLAGSAGSDFHEPGRAWQRLGRLANLPSRVRPVWHHLDAASSDQKDP
jgi:predicted metal-dependent phosphoesterase TrpH